MIQVHIFYPYSADGRFDMAYYCERHMPMVKARLGAACTGFTVVGGLNGGAPKLPPPYAAIGVLHCTSADAFAAAFGPHAKEILGDIPNYTDAKPVMQISETRVPHPAAG